MLEPAPPPWSCPIELVKHAASAPGWAMIFRAEARGAIFQRAATVYQRQGHLCAEIGFVAPIGPEKQDGMVIGLVPPLQENNPPVISLDLPEHGADVRWTPLRKAAVLEAMRTGRLTSEAAHAAWCLQAHEIETWAIRFRLYGLDGLSIHKLQDVGSSS